MVLLVWSWRTDWAAEEPTSQGYSTSRQQCQSQRTCWNVVAGCVDADEVEGTEPNGELADVVLMLKEDAPCVANAI